MGKKMLYIMAIVAVAFLVSGWLKPTEYHTEKRIHTVGEGQTIWGIATKYQPMQDHKMSTGELVYRIYKLNSIDPKAYIQPGDKLIIPLEVEVK